MSIIDRNNPMPLYYQIKEHLKQQINEGILKKGEKLPTELWISQAYKASRVTVRRAIDELVQEGVVERKKGQGVYVSTSSFNRNIQRLTSQFEDLVKAGMSTRSQLLSIKEITADARLTLILEVEKGDKLLQIHRMRFADEKPFSEQIMYINIGYLPDWDPHELESGSLYHVLEDKYHLKISHANQIITAAMPTEEQLKLFHLHEPAPMIHMLRTTFLEGNAPVEFTETYHVAGSYKYSITLYR